MSGTNPSGKRHKADGSGPMGGPPHDGYHGGGYSRMGPQGGYQQHPPYGGPPSGPGHMRPQPGYVPWQHGSAGQYGAPPPPSHPSHASHPSHPPPPHAWGNGASAAPPSASAYSHRSASHPPPSMTPERGGYGGPPPSYRGPPIAPPPPMPGGGPPGSASRLSKVGPPPSRHGSKTPDPSSAGGSDSAAPPPPGGYQWSQSHGGQWPQHQWSNGPQSHGMYPSGPGSGQAGYSSSSIYNGNSPPRVSQSRPRTSPEMMGGYDGGGGGGGPSPSEMCQSVDGPDMDVYTSRGVGPPHDDDGNASAAGRDGESAKDKGRGSYKCGRCGVPKKGHICPYQPKLTRRPGEPLPEMRCAAVQVEMDEFMTLRRLNIRIQGLPESYASEPIADHDIKCVGEPHPSAVMSQPLAAAAPMGPVNGTSERGQSSAALPDVDMQPSPQSPSKQSASPVRSSPVTTATDDPIVTL